MQTSKITTTYALILGIIALVCAAISTGIYLLTKGRIDQVVAQQQRDLLLEVVPQDYFDNDLLSSCKTIKLPDAPYLNKLYSAKKGQDLTAYALQATAPDGYSGNIVLLMGIQPDGKVLGVRTLAHKETPGLGDKIETRISNWIYSFNDKTFTLDDENHWAVKKDGGDFDQFTGATITPRAVVNKVRQTAKWVITELKHHPQLIETFSDCKE
ncbi:electron transport complex subunit RsxG [Ursidibacter maritimus]|uniref:Ion-translocating oxidoreductase complex subunit G n=1 Tax=Ursidibacter maritimus TaxID=1331689 RepID=A0A949T1B9_9PAST|nr:electron transport complex subunit RsxG [Ursidibacter maritimus]KAE9538347.1 electron transport complex subunit RsxG [Ursidibacter maritimus]MBV6523660.1 electron transport complex subunit RsxG [Ursidibacter maritimus]MBV6525553.1 electron transport complex subunit RsxG [Ursidibacter maritimus]MBV6527638.1 electron transport complex subunit RsxG [Ursidibacter maritimus]MBV6529725.1 electron transport complex subunit RsxG [Ursidibacter maritimus]